MRYRKINSNLFVSNRKVLKESLKPNSIALLFGAFQMPRNGDQYFNYRQSSDFFYYTGIEQEKSILLLSNITPSSENSEVLFILKPEKNLEIWEGHKLTKDKAFDVSGIKTIKHLDEFDSFLNNLASSCKNFYFNLPELQKFYSEVRPKDQIELNKIKRKFPLHNYERLAPTIQKQRLIKSEVEIGIIKKACTITKDAFLRVLKNTQPGKMEYEIESEITYEFIRQGANDHAYPPIVAGGENACTLHYIENDKLCNEGDLLLLDFGAEYANYSADLSRTIPINGTFSARQKELYEATLRVFKFARNQIKPGVSISQYHSEVCKVWEEEHIKLGLYSKEDVKNSQPDKPLWFQYYMHGTSHFLGLDVHDVGTRETILEPGMIVTCEPGLYIQEEKTGIRIENDILVTESGNIDLMADIPIEVDEIEEIMNSR